MTRLFLECAIRAALMAGGTAVALRVVRVKSAAARHAAWAAVVVMMLTLPVWTAWGPRASLRVLPAAATGAAVPVNFASQALAGPSASAVSAAPLHASSWNWWTCLAGVYLLGVVTLMIRLGIGTVRAHALLRTAADRDGKLTSPACAAPVTVGWLRPAVILPGCWREWPPAQLEAVMAHEGEHARRRDPLVAWLALVNRAVFWFHPLAWWLERRISGLAEEACDTAVLARGHDPYAYSECLLEMARLVARTGARVDVWGMAMPGTALPRRIRRILEGRPAPRMTRVRMACAAAACATLFAVFSAGAVERRRPEPAAQDRPTPAPAAPQKRLLTVYLDMSAIPDAEKVAAAAQTFLNSRMQAEDLLAVVVRRNGAVQVRQDFTGDRDLVMRTIRQALADTPAQSAASSTGEQLDGLRTIVDTLAPLPGKKLLIFFTGGASRDTSSHQVQVQAVIDAAVRANVAIYAIEAAAPQR